MMKAYIEEVCGGIQETVRETAHAVWEYAELSLEEYRSSNYLTELLARAGFSVERGVAGYPTSFVAVFEHGTGGPAFGLLSEYDALPGLGDREGKRNGHGCGHNLFAAGAVGTALAMQRILQEKNLPGKLVVYGCPGEEQYGCKPFLARQRYFDGLTCILGFHPLEFNGVLYAQHNAITERRYVFHGKSSHAGAEPELGINALSAAELLHVATNYLREHVTSDVRLSYIMEQGGVRPNIIPEMAATRYNIRAQDLRYLRQVAERVDGLARGIAQGWGCTLEIEEGLTFANTVVNRPLAELAYENLLLFGPPAFTAEEQDFVKELGAGVLREDILPLPETVGHYTASTDEGDASWCAPWIRVCASCLGNETPGHSLAVTLQADSSAAVKGTMQTVKIACGMLCRLAQEPQLRQRLLAAHKEKIGAGLPAGEAWPDSRLFPQAPGVERQGGTVTVDCRANPLLPEDETLELLLYADGQLKARGTPEAGAVTIALPEDVSRDVELTLAYTTACHPQGVLLGYCHGEEAACHGC